MPNPADAPKPAASTPPAPSKANPASSTKKAGADDELKEDEPEVAFLRDPLTQTWVSIISSVTIHGVIILLLAVFLGVNYVIQHRKDLSKQQIIIPDSAVATDDVGGIPNPGLNNDPSRPAAQDNDPNATDNGYADFKSDKMSDQLKKDAMSGTNDIGSGNNGHVGRGNGLGNALSGGEGGDEAPFGANGGGEGAGPRSLIFGHGGNAKSICYICDGSGSMSQGGKDEVLRVQLQRAVANLAPLQQFNVMLFQEAKEGGNEFQSLGDHLLMATPADIKRTNDFADNVMSFHGQTDARQALKEAFREKPQLIFLLTDGLWEEPGPDGPGMLKFINELNVDKKVHVDTILLFINKKDETDNPGADDIMEQIAKQNGGVFKAFYADKL